MTNLADTASTMLVLSCTPKSFCKAFASPSPLVPTPKKVFTGRKIIGTKVLGFDGMCFWDVARNWPGKDFTETSASQQRRMSTSSTCDDRTGNMSVNGATDAINASSRKAVSFEKRVSKMDNSLAF